MNNIKTLDSIKRIKTSLPKAPATKRAGVVNLNMDGLARRKATVIKKAKNIRQQKTVAIVTPFNVQRPRTNRPSFLQKFRIKNQAPFVAAVIAVFLAFGGGVLATLNTNKTSADYQPQVLGDSTQVPAGSMTMPNISLPPSEAGNNNDALFNTPIEELQNYLANVSQPDIIANRTTQLVKFLNDMHSPLVSAAGTIANQSHWNLILAISFAESTLGKNCKDNNCSNIGASPASPYWHKYGSYQAWVVDFNRLLDKKYNNWTLEQMCGVYVQPCTANWLAATKEIMTDLNNRGIE